MTPSNIFFIATNPENDWIFWIRKKISGAVQNRRGQNILILKKKEKAYCFGTHQVRSLIETN